MNYTNKEISNSTPKTPMSDSDDTGGNVPADPLALTVFNLSHDALTDVIILNALQQEPHTEAEVERLCQWAQSIVIGSSILLGVLKCDVGILIGKDGAPRFQEFRQSPEWSACVDLLRARHPQYPWIAQSDR